MKARIAVIASILTAFSFSTALAGGPMPDHLWFSMLSSSDASMTATQGPGQTLNIARPNPAPATVRIGINITSNSGALNGWEISLLSSLGGVFANGTAHGSNYDLTFGGMPNGSTAATFGKGSVSASGTVGLIYSFDLVVQEFTPVVVTGDFGQSQAIVKNNGLYWYGFVGANPISYAAGSYTAFPDVTPGWGQIPVVAVGIPEPTTLGLVCLASALLIRRRR